MWIFLDTEFTGWVAPKLISIGLITEYGDSLYLELAGGWAHDECSDFVHVNVLPKLWGGSYRVAADLAPARIREWIEAHDVPSRVVCDYPEYDFALLRTALGEHWPQTLARDCLRFDTSDLRNSIRSAVSRVYARHEQKWGAHHALLDAQRLAEGFAAAQARGWQPAP